MSEMIERVARVIWSLNEDTDCHDYDQLTHHAKQQAKEWARAAIGAMREPTQDMISSCPHEDAWHVWNDMINVALATEPAE